MFLNCAKEEGKVSPHRIVGSCYLVSLVAITLSIIIAYLNDQHFC
jgi:hypothetical protein